MSSKQEMLLKVLISFLNQGYGLKDCFKQLLIYEMISKKQYQAMINSLEKDYQLTGCLTILKFSKVFINYFDFYCNYYPLASSIQYSINIIKRIITIKKEFINTLIYPSILISMTMIALFFMSKYIIPQLSLINPEALVDYQYILLILTYFPKMVFYIFSIVLIFIIISLIFMKYYSNLLFKYWFKIFIIKDLLALFSSLAFTLYLKEVIVKVQLSKQALLILNKQTNNIFVLYVIKELLLQLEQGKHLFDVIKDSKVLTKDLKQTIYLASDSNVLHSLLSDYFDMKISIIQRKIKITLAILLPVIISIVGILLILMYLLIMMPIISLDYQI